MSIYQAYDCSTPYNHVYLMPYFYQKKLPSKNTVNYLNFFQLLKYLEVEGVFSREMLRDFSED